jgi:hypothetical protein
MSGLFYCFQIRFHISKAHFWKLNMQIIPNNKVWICIISIKIKLQCFFIKVCWTKLSTNYTFAIFMIKKLTTLSIFRVFNLHKSNEYEEKQRTIIHTVTKRTNWDVRTKCTKRHVQADSPQTSSRALKNPNRVSKISIISVETQCTVKNLYYFLAINNHS